MKLQRKGEFLSTRVQYIPLGRIRPNPQQPRQGFDEVGLAELAAELCRAVFERAARCTCCNLSAILTLTDAGSHRERPACVCVDGSLFKKSLTYRPALERCMEEFTAARLGRHCVFRTAQEATMLGSAAAALLNV